jgi:hypothetical protein
LSLVKPMTDGLPSWCPDFSNEASARSMDFSNRTVSPKVVKSFESSASFSLSASGDLIKLNAMVVDSVALVFGVPCPWVLNPTTITQQAEERQKKWLLRLYRCFANLGSLTDGFGAELNAFLLSFHDSRIQPQLCSCFSFGAFLAHCKIRNDNDDIFPIHNQHQPSPKNNPDISFDRLEYATPQEKEINTSSMMCPRHNGNYMVYSTQNVLLWTAMLSDTYIFKTASGRFGYSPRLPSPGDRICIVPCGQLLHMFSSGETTRYKGAASIHGLMEDNLLTLVKGLVGRFEEFPIS